MKNEHVSSVKEKVTELFQRPGCSLYDLIQMRHHHQSSINKIRRCLTAVFLKDEEHLSSAQKKSPNCLQLNIWLQIVQAHSNKTSLVITQWNSKVLDSCRDLVLWDEGRKSLICWAKSHRIACSQRPSCYSKSSFTWDMISHHTISSKTARQLSDFFVNEGMHNISHLLIKFHRTACS